MFAVGETTSLHGIFCVCVCVRDALPCAWVLLFRSKMYMLFPFLFFSVEFSCFDENAMTLCVGSNY